MLWVYFVQVAQLNSLNNTKYSTYLSFFAGSTASLNRGEALVLSYAKFFKILF